MIIERFEWALELKRTVLRLCSDLSHGWKTINKSNTNDDHATSGCYLIHQSHRAHSQNAGQLKAKLKKNVCSVFIVWYNVCHLTEINPSDKLSSHLIYELKWKEEINDFMLRSFILCLSWWWYFFILCVFSLTLIVLLLSVWKIHKWNQRKRFAMNYIGFDCSDINIGHFCLPHIWDRFIHSRISPEFHLVYSPFIVHSWFYTFRWNFSA